jgi:hypothetical protein
LDVYSVGVLTTRSEDAAYDVASRLEGAGIAASITDEEAEPFGHDPPHFEYEVRVAASDWELAQDVIGPPARPCVYSNWRTPTVVSIARRVRDTLDFSGIPILADALQEAGCDDPQILAHCRGRGPHTCNCWVLDEVLGTC